MKKYFLIAVIAFALTGTFTVGYLRGYSVAERNHRVFMLVYDVGNHRQLTIGDRVKMEDRLAWCIYMNYEWVQHEFGTNLPDGVLRRREMIEKVTSDYRNKQLKGKQ